MDYDDDYATVSEEFVIKEETTPHAHYLCTSETTKGVSISKSNLSSKDALGDPKLRNSDVCGLSNTSSSSTREFLCATCKAPFNQYSKTEVICKNGHIFKGSLSK